MKAKEQETLDLGEIVNHPTPITKEFLILYPRPDWHHEDVFSNVCLELAKVIREDGEIVEDVAEEISDSLEKFNDFGSSYEVSKFLTDTLHCDDEWIYELRDEIEYFCMKANGILKKTVKEWVDFHNIIPPANVGDHVEFSLSPINWNPKTEKCLIVSDKKDEAKFIIFVPSKNDYTEERALQTKCGYIVEYERIFEWMSRNTLEEKH